MVIQNTTTKNKKANYFMTTEEAMILYKESKRWGSKWRILIGLCLFRGLRIGEAVAINLSDFSNDEFDKLRVILEKSHIVDEFPIIKGFSIELKEYIKKNIHLLKDGWLFPAHSSGCKTPHMSSDRAITKFWKIRKIIGKTHKSFNDTISFRSKGKQPYKRHRISFHSCRRWFETNLWEKYKDKMLIRDIMRYSHSKTVDVYINPYETWKKERELLNTRFGNIFVDFTGFCASQKKLSSYF